MTSHRGTGARARPERGWGGSGGSAASRQLRPALEPRAGSYFTPGLVAVAAVLALIVGGDLWNRFVPGDLLTPPARPDHPMPGYEEAGRPLDTPPPLKAASGSYTFSYAVPGRQRFIAFSPCRPVHYVVNVRHQPDGAGELIADAVARVSEVTGLKFVADGPTAERASADREPFQPERYGDRWAPVLIDWWTTAEEPVFGLEAAPGGTTRLGDARALPVSAGGSPDVLVTGQVRPNATALAARLREPGGAAAVRATIQHELAHVVGLGHTSDQSQLMAQTSSGRTDFGAGDLVGLAALGTGPCAPGI
ncbi:peptidase [Arthrobacter deserti]|uniref:Peptidase n=1 Tax=Arthrobacter deserti TaxID=1742687 RepID=A0ABX1JU54_9MICC|nr:peptidase [Arthrobacter deserti]